MGKGAGSCVYSHFTPPTPPAYPVIPNGGTIFEIFKTSIYCPSCQTRRLSHGAHAAVSNHTCFRRRPASSAPLIQQRSHRLPTFPKSSDGRSAYHATILPPPILLRESPSYKFLQNVIKMTQLFLNEPLADRWRFGSPHLMEPRSKRFCEYLSPPTGSHPTPNEVAALSSTSSGWSVS